MSIYCYLSNMEGFTITTSVKLPDAMEPLSLHIFGDNNELLFIDFLKISYYLQIYSQYSNVLDCFMIFFTLTLNKD